MLRESESRSDHNSSCALRSPLPDAATDCSGIHARVARAIWPQKTALHWAAAAGVKERIVRYWLAGTHEVSASGKLAIVRELD
jgi:hypothetical protein